MDEQAQDPLTVLDADILFLKAEWLSFEFPQYIPVLKGTDDRPKVIVGRFNTAESAQPTYITSVYMSPAAKDRSSLWQIGGRADEITLMKLCDVATAHRFWYNALKKFFQLTQGLTVEDAHRFLMVFNHQDNKPFPAPICVFCHVLALEKKCQQAGVVLTGESASVEEDEQGGTTPPDVENETSDTLDVDLE
jgi:hypothetical protein